MSAQMAHAWHVELWTRLLGLKVMFEYICHLGLRDRVLGKIGLCIGKHLQVVVT